ncbi:acyltransferase family protein [Methanobrevibacter gottschalkii]|uniref:acyltransferase family protein n=1 Tax=Methanobrevibacter gottschalkii TaxID=190974 RepID=UPI0038D1FDE3
MENNRTVFIDYLKVIGLLCIILAHISTDESILQIRNFDVPLMVIISGFLAVNSFKRNLKQNRSFLRYYWKRISRLLFPTWTFLIIFFIVMAFLPINGIYHYDADFILNSFLLLDGLPYVWIIRIFLICTFITPVIYYFDKIENDYIQFLILLLIYILYELSIFLKINETNIIFEFILAYVIPYGIIYLLGMISTKTSPKMDRNVSIICLIAFIIQAAIIYLNTGIFQPTQIMKYPPTVYYISYALFVSFMLLSIFKRIDLKPNRVIEFCSKSSLWIYLWHILFLTVIPLIFGELNWILSYIIIVVCAVGATYIQNKILDLTNADIKVLRG